MTHPATFPHEFLALSKDRTVPTVLVTSSTSDLRDGVVGESTILSTGNEQEVAQPSEMSPGHAAFSHPWAEPKEGRLA
jgi:hypothetical protein